MPGQPKPAAPAQPQQPVAPPNVRPVSTSQQYTQADRGVYQAGKKINPYSNAGLVQNPNQHQGGSGIKNFQSRPGISPEISAMSNQQISNQIGANAKNPAIPYSPAYKAPPPPKTAMDVSYLRKTATALWGKQAQALVAPEQNRTQAIRAHGNDTTLDKQFASAKLPRAGYKAPGNQQTQQFAQSIKNPGLQPTTPAQ